MHISSVNISIHPPIFTGLLTLTGGLNIVGGENGTCKTALLNFIRGNIGNNAICAQSEQGQLRIIAISPKRNSERRTQDQLWQHIRQNNRSGEIIINELQGKGMQLYGFDNYANTGELFYGIYQDRISDGKDQIAHMQKVTEEFNQIISQVFLEYKIVSEWVKQNGVGIPKIRIQKNSGVIIDVENLSIGEQEVLSLILNIYFSSNKTDVYLIDEPEVHLNWHLEEKLFDFLLNIADKQGKQFIVVTHSKVIFKGKFYPKCQFLSWNNGRIQIQKRTDF